MAAAVVAAPLSTMPAAATCYSWPFAVCPDNNSSKSTLIDSTAFPALANASDARAMAFVDANDGSRRRYVPLQGGRILVWKGGASFLGTDFHDISAKVRSPGDGGGNEQGLLALAFHPSYAENGYFYVKFVSSGSEAAKMPASPT